MSAPQLFRPKELAKVLHVSERCVRNWQKCRIIPFIKVGRVVLFDFEKVMSALEGSRERRRCECTTAKRETR